MQNIYKFESYVSYLNELVANRKTRGETKAELAKTLGCQAAYLSQVLAGKVHLTEEHILRLCESMNFNEVETEYLLLLLRFAKAGSPGLRRYLSERRERLRESSQELEATLSAKKNKSADELAAYYTSSFLPSLIHLATSCDELQNKESLLARFGLDEATLDFHLSQLEQFRLIGHREERWVFRGLSAHFSKGSPLETQLQVTRRLLTLNRLSVRRESDLHYSVIFTADESMFLKLRLAFLKSIEQMHRDVEPVVGQDVYAICLDLFRP